MDNVFGATSPPPGHTSILCELCKHRIFSKEAWRRFWARSVGEQKYVSTWKELLAGQQIGCWFCECIIDRCTWIGTVDITMELALPPDVDPPKLNAMRLTLWPPKSENQAGKLFRLALYTTAGKCVRCCMFDSMRLMDQTDDPASEMIRAPLQHEPMSFVSSDARLAVSWIRRCQNNHEECQRFGQLGGRIPAPSRLLDVLQSDQDYMKVESVSPGTDIEYVALSYCWGSSNHCRNTSSTRRIWQNGIYIPTTPRTIQDAIRVTQMMKIRYLWVDSICIKQDSDEDKIKELSLMGAYYRNALLVIAASNANEASSGFLGCLPQLRSPFPSVAGIRRWQDGTTVIAPFYTDSGCAGEMTVDLVSEPYDWRAEPIEKRAWTLQERLLCPRVLNFPSSGSFYLQCNRTRTHRDTIHFGLAADRMFTIDSTVRSNLDHQDQSRLLHEAWLMHVRDYSRRLITNTNDKFIAIAGVAEAYRLYKGGCLGNYLAGHWSSFLVESLNWRVYDSHLRMESNPRRDPSWSWLSIDSPVIPISPVIMDKCFRSLVHVHFSAVEPLHEQLPFGSVKVGCISMRARVGRATWTSDRDRGRRCSLRLGNEDSHVVTLASTDTVEAFPASPKEVYFIPLCEAGVGLRIFGLIVQRVAPSYEHLFKRVGHFEDAPQAFLEACSMPMMASVI